MNNKKIVFISHITEESELAKIIAEEIEHYFLGLLDTFVSSDGKSIPTGERWLDLIDNALANSAIQISLCSPQSIKRPWINFEAGASWIRKIPVVPLCHSGLSKSNLPIPMVMLQAADLDKAEDLKGIFLKLSNILDAKNTPEINYNNIIEKCKAFTENYTYFDKVFETINTVCNIENSLNNFFFSGEIQNIHLSLKDYIFLQLAPNLDYLRDLELITYSFPSTRMTWKETFRDGDIALKDKFLKEILPHLKQE